MKVGLVQMGWHPDDCWCVCLSYLSLRHKIEKMVSNNGGSRVLHNSRYRDQDCWHSDP